MRARGLLAAVAIAVSVATEAEAQNFELQCFIQSRINGTFDLQTMAVQPGADGAVIFGNKAGNFYFTCNQSLPVATPGRWLCVTDGSGEFFKGGFNIGSGAYATLRHLRPGHEEYHAIRVIAGKPWSSLAPMAFPAHDADGVGLRFATSIAGKTEGERVWASVRFAGYLGRDAGATRDTACLP